MDQNKIQRINELAKKAKTSSLTDEECAEREILRKEYLESVRSNFRATLDSIEFTDGKNTNASNAKK